MPISKLGIEVVRSDVMSSWLCIYVEAKPFLEWKSASRMSVHCETAETKLHLQLRPVDATWIEDAWNLCKEVSTAACMK